MWLTTERPDYFPGSQRLEASCRAGATQQWVKLVQARDNCAVSGEDTTSSALEPAAGVEVLVWAQLLMGTSSEKADRPFPCLVCD